MITINEDGILDENEPDYTLLFNELKELFQFVNPKDLRKTIEYYFFNCEMKSTMWRIKTRFDISTTSSTFWIRHRTVWSDE